MDEARLVMLVWVRYVGDACLIMISLDKIRRRGPFGYFSLGETHGQGPFC